MRMFVRPFLLLAATLALATTAVGCGSTETVFATRYAPELRRDAMTVSVFGVFKDGRMNADAWLELAPRFAATLGGTACESMYGDVLMANDRPVASAVDDQARSEGVTEELLDLFAPAASSDAILLLTVSGNPPKTTPGKGTGTSAGPSMSTGRGGGRRGGGRGRPSSGSSSHSDHDAYEVSAELFSVREHRTLGVVAMTYTGKSVDEALASFVERFRAELPGTRCVSWKPDVHVAADKVRAVHPKE